MDRTSKKETVFDAILVDMAAKGIHDLIYILA